MKTSCVYIPKKGKNLFKSLRKNFSYEKSWDIMYKVFTPKFAKAYKNILEYDEEGYPTMESVLNTPYIKKWLGLETLRQVRQKNFQSLADTRDNYKKLLEEAYNYNSNSNNDYVAVVEKKDDKLQISLKLKNDAALKEFKDQYGAVKLNESLSKIFTDLGITVDNLEEAEVRRGILGKTNFDAAKNIGKGLASIIMVANNMNGEKVMSEEFAHLIVGVFKEEPLVKRALDILKNNKDYMQQVLGEQAYNQYMEAYNNDLNNLAEETLGHILQNNLFEAQEKLSTPNNAKSLFKRLYNWIISKFKKFKSEQVIDTLDGVNAIMNDLAFGILKGNKKITKRDIKNNSLNKELYALEKEIDKNIEILKEAVKVEAKRAKIMKNPDKTNIKNVIDDLLMHTNEESDTIEGILNYAHSAVMEMKIIEGKFMAFDFMDDKSKFEFLINAKSIIQSYAGFVHNLDDVLSDADLDDENSEWLKNYLVDKSEINVVGIVKELKHLSTMIMNKWSKTAIPLFADFMKPYLGEKITVPFGKYAGTEMAIEDLLKEAPNDISFMDRWMQSMADSSDVLLQGYAAAVNKENNNTRLETIDAINEINKFRRKIESYGITNFEWMFEKDSDGNKSGNYISEINYAQFDKDLNDMYKRLEEKYGKNPSGQKARDMLNERNAWLEENAVSILGTPKPNPIKYKNKDYTKLTARQKEILEEFLTFKERFDNMYPDNRVYRLKAIQIRKNRGERFWESITSPSTLFENVKEAIAEDLLVREDDNDIFGETAQKGLTNFDGSEYMNIPALFTIKLKNPNEISTDVIGSLIAYAYSAIQYKNLNNIVDALEVGKFLINTRDTKKVRGDKEIMEKFSIFGMNLSNKALDSGQNAKDKLQDFMESQVYHKYLKEGSTISLKDKDISTQKITNQLLRFSSLAGLGFNYLVNIANVATGVGMTNIEAAAGQFFNVKELAKADKEYATNLPGILADFGRRAKQNKVSLLFDLLDVKQNFGRNTKRLQSSNLLKRLFGEDVAFLGQECGDHWLYSRVAIAMCLRQEVLKDGKKMSLWEALQVKDFEGDTTIKRLDRDNIKNLDGTDFDFSKFSAKVKHVNQVLFGIYNDEDMNAASRVAMGRLLQQYRKWMTIQFSRRFRKGHKNVATDTWEEGYYRTVGRILMQLKRGEVQLGSVWKNLSKEEQYNVKRAMFEMAQFAALWLLVNLIDWPDDKDRSWAIKLAEYSSRRLVHELGTLAPSFTMPEELLKTVKSPIPSVTTANDLFKLLKSACWPFDWVDEVKSGPYKGMSTLEKNFVKAPLPIIAQIKQINRFTDELDTSINFLTRPY